MFDSGFGGLSILKHIVRELPDYEYLYLGDTARAPYGSRSKETIRTFTEEAVDFLFKKGAELIIIACNTASAEALPEIQRSYAKKYGANKRVLGVIVPTLEYVSKLPDVQRIGVLATESTVASGAYEKELRKLTRLERILSQSAPLLVPLVEAGETNSQIRRTILKRYINPLKRAHIDTLILACTHYGHLEGDIQAILGRRISVINQGPVVARKLNEYLVRHPEIERTLKKTRRVKFYSTESSKRFERLGKVFYGKSIRPKIVSIDNV